MRAPASRPSLGLPGRLASLPRPLLRALLAAVVVLTVVAVWTGGVSGVDDGRWDVSTHGERVRSNPPTRSWSPINGLLAFFSLEKQSRFSWSDLAQHAAAAPQYGKGPNLGRLHNGTTHRTYKHHRGFSRSPVAATQNPVQYDLAPLPSIEEAFAHLHPRLRSIKDRVPQVPREHDLCNPIFQPFLNPELTARYAHLQEQRDLSAGAPRYLFVAICRQVAGVLPALRPLLTVSQECSQTGLPRGP